MDKLTVVPPIKIDLSIKQRKKAVFNKRHQLENPIGDYFALPEKCSRLHSNNRFNCVSISREDVLQFRAKLYETSEKRDQREFLSQFIITQAPKRRTGQAQVARVMQVYYKLTKVNGQEVPICREMFYAVTGLGRARVNTIVQKQYKKLLLEHGDDDLLNDSPNAIKKFSKTAARDEKLKTILIQKKEKMLSLAKGTFEEFSKALKDRNRSGSGTEEVLVEQMVYEDGTIVEYIEETLVEEVEDPEQCEKIVISQLDLDSFETCRICLSSGDLLPLNEKMKDEEYTFAEMVEYGLGIQLPKTAELPSKICETCIERVKISCQLRNDFVDAQEIIELSLKEQKHFEIPESEESQKPLVDYIKYFDPNQTDLLGQDFDESTIIEEIVVEDFKFKKREVPKKINMYEKMRPKKCHLCNMDFEEESPEEHFQINHAEIKLTKCVHCEFETEFPWFLNLHYQIHAEDFHLCQNCGKTFPGSKYGAHKSWCGKPRVFDKLHTCPYCDATYQRAYDLRVHERIHTNERPYKCTECENTFFKRMSLRRHLLKHGIGVGCHCSGCGKGYIQKYELLRHQSYCLKKEF